MNTKAQAHDSPMGACAHPVAHPAPVERVTLSDEQIDAAIGKPLDDLLDHIYEYSTAAEGIKERARRIARAVIAEYERINGIAPAQGEQP